MASVRRKMMRGCAVGCIVTTVALTAGTARAEQALPQVTIDAPADTKPKPPRRHAPET
ncbi:hypothetical protein DYI24_26090, partial [Rhodopseudomonas sp. BR0C11]|nr:hypothetical protein [Rhodopseudomonas sp. BR0C11]